MISSPPDRNASGASWVFLAFLVLTTCFLGGCAGTSSQYHSVAYQPASLSDLTVKVSLNLQMVYVMEGDRCLMVTPTCVGKPGYPTPQGQFKVTSKNPTKRSETYGYWVNGKTWPGPATASPGPDWSFVNDPTTPYWVEIRPGKSSEPPGPGWSYIGYPMAYWVEFAPGFGFHEGPIWPYPRSHGCLHLHETASAKFFELVQIGTPVEIAATQPEDALYGRAAKRPTDYADPDPPPLLMISPEFFQKPRENQLLPVPPS